MQIESTMTGAVATEDSVAAPNALANRLAAAACAALFGVFLLWGVGFSQLEAFHNAAHDTRHSNAFPCH